MLQFIIVAAAAATTTAAAATTTTMTTTTTSTTTTITATITISLQLYRKFNLILLKANQLLNFQFLFPIFNTMNYRIVFLTSLDYFDQLQAYYFVIIWKVHHC